MATFLLSEEWPAVATMLQEPKKTKSLVTLLWHWWDWKRERFRKSTRAAQLEKKWQALLTKKDRLSLEESPTWNKLSFPSPSATPNLLPCWLKRTRVTLAKAPGARGVETGWIRPHSHICTEPSWDPVKSGNDPPRQINLFKPGGMGKQTFSYIKEARGERSFAWFRPLCVWGPVKKCNFITGNKRLVPPKSKALLITSLLQKILFTIGCYQKQNENPITCKSQIPQADEKKEKGKIQN